MDQASSESSAYREDVEKLERDLNTRIVLPPIRTGPVPTTTDFTATNLLGAGAFGCVIGAVHNTTSKQYAIKIVHERRQTNTQGEQDIQIAAKFNFIAKQYWHFREGEYILIVTEYSPYGTLVDVWNGLNEDEIRFVIAQLILAVEYLHKNDVVHRDIKAVNVLIAEDGYIRLGDFGLAKQIRHGRTQSLVGSYSHMAPEMVINDGHGYGTSVDWYAVGACFYELLDNSVNSRWQEIERLNPEMLPFVMTGGLLYRIDRTNPPGNLSEEGSVFLEGLLEINPSERLGVADGGVEKLMHNPWLAREYNFSTLYAKRYDSPLLRKVRRIEPFLYWRRGLSQDIQEMFPERVSSSRKRAA